MDRADWREARALAVRYPYLPSSGILLKAVEQFRRSFPATIDVPTIQKLNLAPGNESELLAVLKFLGFIDENGQRTDLGAHVFTEHDNTEFARKLEAAVRSAYRELFELHGDGAWELNDDALIAFFRRANNASELVGKRQASTFSALRSLAGHGSLSPRRRRAAGTAARAISAPAKPGASAPREGDQEWLHRREHEFGLTVRIEINLPTVAEQEVYDKIFKSIRENLLGA